MDRIYGHGTKPGMITFSQITDLVLKIRWFTFISQFRCFVGKRHLEEAMKAFSNNLHFEVTWKPFFLNPATPDTGVPLEQYLSRKYGPRVAAQAKEGTSPLSRAGMNVVITYTTVIDLSRSPVNKGTTSRRGLTKYSDLYEIVHPSLVLISLCLLTGA